MALRLTASEKETRDVAAEKVENQKLLGLSFQEKGMLDMALATFNKLPFTEDMKLVYVNLGLDYENRGQRDKAYLVYKKVFDVDPRFEDVAPRLERLSQARASASLFGAPTGRDRSRLRRPTRCLDSGRSRHAPPSRRRSPRVVPLARGQPARGTDGPGGPDRARPAALPRQSRPRAASSRKSRSETSLPTQMAPRSRADARDARDRGRLSPPRPTPVPGGPVVPGSRFGRYEVERHLGRGGMGDVYLVRDTVINRQAALKTIRLDTDLDPKQLIEMRQRFYREAQTAGSLHAPQHRHRLRRGRRPGHVLHRDGVRRGPDAHAVDEEAALQRAADQARHLPRGHGARRMRTRTASSTATSSPTTSCCPRSAP